MFSVIKSFSNITENVEHKRKHLKLLKFYYDTNYFYALHLRIFRRIHSKYELLGVSLISWEILILTISLDTTAFTGYLGDF